MFAILHDLIEYCRNIPSILGCYVGSSLYFVEHFFDQMPTENMISKNKMLQMTLNFESLENFFKLIVFIVIIPLN